LHQIFAERRQIHKNGLIKPNAVMATLEADRSEAATKELQEKSRF
jgi:hypothetical protein